MSEALEHLSKIKKKLKARRANIDSSHGMQVKGRKKLERKLSNKVPELAD